MKREMKILLYADALFMLAGGLFGPIYAIFVEGIGGSLSTAGTAYSVYCIVAAILVFIFGKFEDKFKNQEALIVVGYFIMCLAYIGYLFISKPLHLYIVQMIFGIGVAVNLPVYRGVYSRNLDRGKYASEWGIWDSITYLFWGISSFVGGFIADMFGFRFLFYIMVGLSVAGLLVSSTLLFFDNLDKKKKKK